MVLGGERLEAEEDTASVTELSQSRLSSRRAIASAWFFKILLHPR